MRIERLTLSEIAQSSLAAVRVLERHGIDYCADSGRSLHEVCIASNINPEVVLEELSNAEAPEVEDRDWTTAPLQDVLEFLVATDHAYIRSELKLLTDRLCRVVEEAGEMDSVFEHLPRVFANLREDLEVHMGYEEREVFPAIRRFIEGIEAGEALKGSPLAAFGGPLRVMDNEHETAGAALRLLRDFAQDYKVPENASLRYRALVLGLEALEDRLLRHIYIENNVLFPRAAALKGYRTGNLSGAAR